MLWFKHMSSLATSMTWVDKSYPRDHEIKQRSVDKICWKKIQYNINQSSKDE